MNDYSSNELQLEVLAPYQFTSASLKQIKVFIILSRLISEDKQLL